MIRKNPHHGERQHKAQTKHLGKEGRRVRRRLLHHLPHHLHLHLLPSAAMMIFPNRPQAVKLVQDPEQADHEAASLEEEAHDEGEATVLVKVMKVRTKKSKKSCRLRDEKQEGEVLEWVEENELLWNSKHKEFKLKPKKDRLWAEKAEELGYDGKLLFCNCIPRTT